MYELIIEYQEQKHEEREQNGMLGSGMGCWEAKWDAGKRNGKLILRRDPDNTKIQSYVTIV